MPAYSTFCIRHQENPSIHSQFHLTSVFSTSGQKKENYAYVSYICYLGSLWMEGKQKHLEQKDEQFGFKS